ILRVVFRWRQEERRLLRQTSLEQDLAPPSAMALESRLVGFRPSSAILPVVFRWRQEQRRSLRQTSLEQEDFASLEHDLAPPSAVAPEYPPRSSAEVRLRRAARLAARLMPESAALRPVARGKSTTAPPP